MKLSRVVFVLFVMSLSSSFVFADTFTAYFHTGIVGAGTFETPTVGQVTFTLNGDGTISGDVSAPGTAPQGGVFLFMFNNTLGTPGAVTLSNLTPGFFFGGVGGSVAGAFDTAIIDETAPTDARDNVTFTVSRTDGTAFISVYQLARLSAPVESNPAFAFYLQTGTASFAPSDFISPGEPAQNYGAVSTSPVPEPGSLLLIATGLAGFGGIRRRVS